MRAIVNGLFVAAVLLVGSAAWGAADEYEESIRAFLKENFDGKPVCMVVGLIDANGVRVYGAGNLGEGKDRPADADTLFEIGSCTKTFTALLLEDMARRGEVGLDDPVAKYLPPTVKVPSRGGKQITLANLAAQDSGLPFSATNHTGKDWYERFARYTVADMYEFLSGYRLTRDPGAAFGYSNIGMGVLGHALSLKAGASYESLVVERICRPLGMSSTRVTVTPELRPRMAIGHDKDWKPTPDLEIPAMEGAGAIRSSANDLAKYVGANVGLVQSDLGPLMREMQVVRHRTGTVEWGNTAMPWYDMSAYSPPGSDLTGHGGGTGGFATFIGLDKGRRRGVVVLSNQERIHSSIVGYRILQRARLEGLDPVKMVHVQQITGVGLVLGVDAKGQRPMVIGALPKSPSARAGIVAGSVIESIDGVSAAGKTVQDCAALIRGEAGSVLRLGLKGPNDAGPETVTLTREQFLVGE